MKRQSSRAGVSVSRRAFLGQGALGAAAASLGAQAVSAATTPSAPRANPWKYDVDALRQVDPALVHYEECVRVPLNSTTARRCAVAADGRVWVADGRRLRAFRSDGTAAATLTLDDLPRAVEPAADGTLFVAFRDHVRVLEPDGRTRSRWTALPGKPFLTGLAANPREGELYVADSGNRVVYRCDLQGRVQLRLGEKNPDRKVPGLVLPSPFLDVEVGADGLLAINNPGRHLVEFYQRDGERVRSWGRPGVAIDAFCGCCNPIALARRPDGRVIAAEKGLPRVKIYSAAGALESVVAGPSSFAAVASETRESMDADTAHDGLDVAVQVDGRVWVLDLVGGVLLAFRPKTESANAASKA